MIVRFDKLNRFETPKFVLCNPGSVYSNGLTTNTVGALIDTSDEEINFNFNALSELRMRVNKVIREDEEDNSFVNKLYRCLQNRRLIFVEGIGYFSISNVEDGFDGERDYKDITAQSCEVEIQRKNLTYIADGTYKFDTLLELIVSTLPKWVIGHMDATVIARYRTFENVDTSLDTLGFMLGDMQEAYECIFVFDIVNRQINVYDQNNYVVRTDIHITKDDFIQNLHIDENADDLYTAISVFGDENLNIAAVNPLGTTTIYNFNHYLDWMSDGLREKVISWTELQESVFDDYYQKNLEYYEIMTERSAFEAERAKQQIVLDTYKKLRENILSTSNYTRLDDYNEVITENGGTAVDIQYDIAATVAKIDELIAATNTTISSLNTSISELNSSMETQLVEIETIHDSVSISKYFTQEEYDELYDYIFEGQYTDSYITVTEGMTHTERFKQMKVLYDRAKVQLERVSVPTQEFNIDVENFVFVKDFEPWSKQLETGCLINVELEANNIAALFLASITINYADKGLSFTFGNRYNKFDPKALFDKMLGGVNRSSNTIEYIKNVVYPIKDGQLDEFAEALNSSRTLTMNSAIASTNQEVVIDDSGYTGRKVLSDGSFDPRQLKIVHNSIILTANSWDRSEVAIGEIILGDGETAYGVNAQTVIGDIIMGKSLRILDNSGNDILTVVDGKIESSVGEAGKTATNYLRHDKTGLTVGDYTENAYGSNVHITPESVEVRDGEIVLSSFGKEEIKLGANNRNAIIDLCNGALKMMMSNGYFSLFGPNMELYGFNDENRTAGRVQVSEDGRVWLESSTKPFDGGNAEISSNIKMNPSTMELSAEEIYIRGLQTPDDDSDAANKFYVDTALDTALAGKAPAGFGLDNNFTTATKPEQVDGYKTCGWYRYVPNDGTELVPGTGITYAGIRVDSYSADGISVQTAYPAASYPGSLLRRYYTGGAWSEWEWVNPPMVPGVEYRTVERYNGKVVYAMTVNAGGMVASGTMPISISGAAGINIVRYVATMGGHALPLNVYGVWTDLQVLNAASLQLRMRCDTASLVGGSVKVYMWYTKD